MLRVRRRASQLLVNLTLQETLNTEIHNATNTNEQTKDVRWFRSRNNYFFKSDAYESGS